MAEKKADSQKNHNDHTEKNTPTDFPVVGIGSSAGGLGALKDLFSRMPTDGGMSFVVVTHQAPGHESILTDLLSRETEMPVENIRDGVIPRKNYVYILPPGRNVVVRDGVLRLTQSGTTKAGQMPVDAFFRSLAVDLRERAICVILSGTGTDGTLGLREIKAQGGLALVQDIESAGYGGMPSSAAGTHLADAVLPPAEMPGRLVSFAQGPYLRDKQRKTGEGGLSERDLTEVFRLVRSRTGHDFSQYKQSTVRRRIERRMTVHGFQKPRDYIDYLHENRHESRMLFSEMLISVTSFFRDREAWDALKRNALPELVQSRPDDHELRVWVPGCATGEEAYSAAIILAEISRELDKPLDIRVFATDLDEQAIEHARRGVYPASIASDVSRERLERFFNKEGEDAYTVRKEIRDMLVFAVQNVLSDPPFVKLDLLVCRNLLIYLGQELQNNLLPMFHYALRQKGLLFLGASESVGGNDNLFFAVDPRWKIYKRTDVPSRTPDLSRHAQKADVDEERDDKEKGDAQPRGKGLIRLIERVLMDRFVPTGIIVDSRGTVLYIHGRTGEYLEPEQQEPKNNVFEMAREGLRGPLTVAVRQAVEQRGQVTRAGVRVKTNGQYTLIDLNVSPLDQPESIRGLLLITLTPSTRIEPELEDTWESNDETDPATERIRELERELRYTKESQQISGEELQTTNEELQSSNEELQSTNEELQSSKEEMESLNEELTTVNNELGSKIESLSSAEDDMRNLLNSTDMAVIYVDDHLRVKRFTEKARDLVNLRDTDTGRPLEDFNTRLEYNGLLDDCREVLDNLVRKEREVRTTSGTWQMMRILPYRTSENVIGGVVIIFVDISRIKEAEQRAVQAEEIGGFFSSIVQTMREPLLVLRRNMQVVQANKSFHRTFGTKENETDGVLIYDLCNGQWEIPQLRKLFEEFLSGRYELTDFTVEHDFPRIGHKKFLLNARRLRRAENTEELILLAMESVDEKEDDQPEI